MENEVSLYADNTLIYYNLWSQSYKFLVVIFEAKGWFNSLYLNSFLQNYEQVVEVDGNFWLKIIYT